MTGATAHLGGPGVGLRGLGATAPIFPKLTQHRRNAGMKTYIMWLPGLCACLPGDSVLMMCFEGDKSDLMWICGSWVPQGKCGLVQIGRNLDTIG